MRSRLLGWFFVAIVLTYSADAQTRDYRSANGQRARIIDVGKSRESRIEIRLASGKLIRWKSFASADGEHGKGVDHAAWTVDGDFFVFNTSNTGGHQPWSCATYFYSRRRNKFYSLDRFVGPITSDFTVAEANRLSTTRFSWITNEPEPNEERIVVRLNRLRL